MPLLPEVKIFMIGGEIDCQHSGQRGFGLGKGRGAWESGRTWMRLVGSMGRRHEPLHRKSMIETTSPFAMARCILATALRIGTMLGTPVRTIIAGTLGRMQPMQIPKQ